MGQTSEIHVSIIAVDGGYIVQLPNGTSVCTSLNKAIKQIRDTLTVGSDEAAE